jgi:hypothetical protein
MEKEGRINKIKPAKSNQKISPKRKSDAIGKARWLLQKPTPYRPPSAELSQKVFSHAREQLLEQSLVFSSHMQTAVLLQAGRHSVQPPVVPSQVYLPSAPRQEHPADYNGHPNQKLTRPKLGPGASATRHKV